MSEIKSSVDELNKINNEIQILKDKMKKLNQRKKILEKDVQMYLSSNNLEGFKYKNSAIILENKQVKRRKGKKDKIEDINNILKKNGVYNENLAKNILIQTQGNLENQNKLKIVKR
jgi:hypothetical protein